MYQTLRTIFGFRLSRYAFYISAAIFSFSVLFPEQKFFASQLVNFAPQGVLICIALGVGFLMLDIKPLLFTMFFTAALVSLHLKYTTNDNFKHSSLTSVNEELEFSLLDVTELQYDSNKLREKLRNNKADIIAIQSLQNNNVLMIDSIIQTYYPYITHNHNGLAIFSKKPIQYTDTIRHEGLSAIAACITLKENICINVVNVNTDDQDESNVEAYLKTVEEYIASRIDPTICAGDFNMVSWGAALKNFKKNLQLSESKIGYIPGAFEVDVFQDIISTQSKYIFHSKEIHCSGYNKVLAGSKRGENYSLEASFEIPDSKVKLEERILSYYPY